MCEKKSVMYACMHVCVCMWCVYVYMYVYIDTPVRKYVFIACTHLDIQVTMHIRKTDKLKGKLKEVRAH